MNLASFIQNLVTGSAVVLGLTYIVGGLIVNLNLARRGLVEYQILKVKYLVVGIIFLLQVVGVFVFACLPSFLLALINVNSIYFFEAINIVSMFASISLLLVWSKYSALPKSFLTSWRFWFIASAIGYMFPALQVFRLYFSPDYYTYTSSTHIVLRVVINGQAILTAILTFIAQIFHYSAFYYGAPSEIFGSLDPIGIGIPSRVRIACLAEHASLLKNLGVPMSKKSVTSDLFLIDETDTSYIIALNLMPHANTLKIDKSLVKAMLYIR
jgi:hypothetical protein